MNANHCCAKQNRSNNRFLPIEPDTAVLLRPISLDTHTNLVAFWSDNWQTPTHSSHTEKLGNFSWLNESGERVKERVGGGGYKSKANFAAVHYANQADRFD